MVYVSLCILFLLIAVISYIALIAYQRYKSRMEKTHFLVLAGGSLLLFLVACGKPFAKEATIGNKMYAKQCIMTLRNQDEQKKLLEKLEGLNKEREVYSLANECFDIMLGHKKNKEVVS